MLILLFWLDRVKLSPFTCFIFHLITSHRMFRSDHLDCCCLLLACCYDTVHQQERFASELSMCLISNKRSESRERRNADAHWLFIFCTWNLFTRNNCSLDIWIWMSVCSLFGSVRMWFVLSSNFLSWKRSVCVCVHMSTLCVAISNEGNDKLLLVEIERLFPKPSQLNVNYKVAYNLAEWYEYLHQSSGHLFWKFCNQSATETTLTKEQSLPGAQLH